MKYNNYLKQDLMTTQFNVPFSSDQYLPVRLSPSLLAQKNLLHLDAYGEMVASQPFFCSISGLSAYCLLYTIEGEGCLHINGKTYDLTPHKLAYYYCNSKHELSIKSCNWKFIQYFFNGPSANLYYNEYKSSHSIVGDISALSHITKSMDELNLIYTRNTMQAELIISMLLTDIMTDLIMPHKSLSTPDTAVPSYILNLKQQLETNYYQDISLDQLAIQYNRSKYRIIRDFTNYLHDTPINYLINCRIKVAKDLLSSTDLSITMISYHVGIENVTHFINLFKKATGITPLNYRKEHQLHIN